MTEHMPRIAVVGAGAAGCTTAIRLLEKRAGSTTPLEILLIDSAPGDAHGVAYGTPDRRHRLNVPAGRMSAYADKPLDFVHWLHRTGRDVREHDFVPRIEFGRYLEDVLRAAVGQDGRTQVRRLRHRVVGASVETTSVRLRLDSGADVVADAAVLALGVFPPDSGWAPEALRRSPCLRPDPWAPDALTTVPEDRDVLLVGTGLTMVDVALSLVRPHRTVHAISRNGLLPRAHAAIPPPPIPPPEPAAPADLASARRTVLRHIATQRRTGRDWQAAVDGLRPVLSTWWQRLPAADQMRFLTRDRRLWDAHRHRIPADTAAEIERLRELGQLVVHTGKITAARQDGDDLLVRLSSGRILAVASVVNCTGPQEDMRRTGDPLLESLFTTGQARVGPASLGLDTARDGHVLPADGGSAGPLWTIGALRKGNLWETTAFAEIRDQADRIAIAVLTTVDMQDHIERAEV